MNKFFNCLAITALVASAASATVIGPSGPPNPPDMTSVLSLTYTGVSGRVEASFSFDVLTPSSLVFEPNYTVTAPGCVTTCTSSAGIYFNGRWAGADNDCPVPTYCFYDMTGGIGPLAGIFQVGTYTLPAIISVQSLGAALPSTSSIHVDMVVLSGLVSFPPSPSQIPEPATYISAAFALGLILSAFRGSWMRGEIER